MFNDLRSYYNPNAAEYFNCTYTIDLNDIYKKITQYFSDKKGLILDIGAGSCRDSRYLSSFGYNVVSFDLSVELLRLAAAEYNGKFSNGSMLEMPFKNMTFKYALANASFLHIPKVDAMRALNEIFRILKNEGLFYLSVKKGAGESIDERGRFFAYYSENELTDCLTNVGFNVIECQPDKSADNRNIQWIYAVAQKK